jgi:hypothetical protein
VHDGLIDAHHAHRYRVNTTAAALKEVPERSSLKETPQGVSFSVNHAAWRGEFSIEPAESENSNSSGSFLSRTFDGITRAAFVREKLDYRSTRDAGVEYLRLRHEEFLPEALRAEGVTGTTAA